MSLARFFSKPRWLSKDAAVRREAVAHEKAAELVSQLARFAREDADAGVRIAALKRLAEPGLAQAMAQDDRDEGVRTTARTLFTELLAGTHPSAPPLADRIRLLRAQDDARLIEQIAVIAPEAELRLAAFLRVDRPALILERVTADADASVRLAALERITDETQLVRISERARKSDKTISRIAAERLHALRVERGDPDSISQRARELCEQLERLLRDGDSSDQATLLDDAWKRIADKAPAQLTTRYRNARELFELSRDPEKIARMRQRSQDRTRLESELGAIEHSLRHPAGVSQADLQMRFNDLGALHAGIADDDDESGSELSVRFARLGAQIAAMKPELEKLPDAESHAEELANRAAADAERSARAQANRAEREGKQKEQLLKLDAAIQATAKAIAAGKSAEAHAAHAELNRLRRDLQTVPPALREALADVEGDYTKIQEWQRWSDGNRRQQLCEELEVLPETGLHPDALATRVREIQTEWATLDRLEARPARASEGIDRRFRALCHKAIEPAKPYFEKRDALRKQGSDETSQLINEAKEAVAAENPDWRALTEMRKRGVEGLRSLDRVNPRERKNLAAEIKHVLSIIDERINALHAEVETAKAGLIGRAEALSEQTDSRTAISQARDLQKLWQASGNGKRARDQAQWKIFRAAIDAVFSRADNERAERSAQELKAIQDAENLCIALETIASSSDTPDRGEVQRIESEWRALNTLDNALRQRFLAAQTSLDGLKARAEKSKRRARFDVWISHHSLLRKLESGAIDVSTFDSAQRDLPTLTIASEAFQSRRNASSGASSNHEDDADALRDCVIEMEQLAGIEPPEVDRQRRMDLQMEKLSARMRGVQTPAPAAALETLLTRWIELGPISADDGAREARFQRALVSALDTLG